MVLAVFCVCSFSNAALWICFASIHAQAAKFLDVDNAAINMLSTIYMFLYLPGSLVASFVM